MARRKFDAYLVRSVHPDHMTDRQRRHGLGLGPDAGNQFWYAERPEYDKAAPEQDQRNGLRTLKRVVGEYPKKNSTEYNKRARPRITTGL